MAAGLIMKPVTVTQVGGLCHALFGDGTADVHFFVVVVQYARASRLFEVRWVVPPLNWDVLGQNYSWARAASIGLSRASAPLRSSLLTRSSEPEPEPDSAKFVHSFRRSG